MTVIYTWRNLLFALLFSLCGLLGNACAEDVTPPTPALEIEGETNSPITEMLMTAISLLGVNYKFGGSTPDSGFDCSGFVRHLFATTLLIDLPRSSMAMAKAHRGITIKRDALKPGDLVFYNTRKRPYSHVGIYIGEDRFIHAPSRGKSVEIVDMGDRYWKKRFNGARRLIESPIAPPDPTNENAAPN